MGERLARNERRIRGVPLILPDESTAMRTHRANGPKLITATIALAVAAACFVLLTYLLTSYGDSGSASQTQTGVHAPARQDRAIAIPVAVRNA
jgi:hypothetical protein